MAGMLEFATCATNAMSTTATTATNMVTRSDTVATDNAVWPMWVEGLSNTGTATTGTLVWLNWVEDTSGRYPITSTTTVWREPNQAKGRIIQTRKLRRCQKRGRELLRSIVSPEQWKEYRQYQSIREVGALAIYEVGCGWMGHVYQIGFNGEPERKLCLQMGARMNEFGNEDRIAAIILALRENEAATVARAGVHHWGEHERERIKARRGHTSYREQRRAS